MKIQTLSLILPAYHSHATLPDLVEECIGILPHLVADYEIIVVDDGSADDTGRIADRLAAEHVPVMVLRQRVRRGYGAAVAAGVAASYGDAVLIMDGSARGGALDLPRCLPRLEQSDLLTGYRRQLPHGPDDRLARTLARSLFSIGLQDPLCGFTLGHGHLLRQIPLVSRGRLVHAEIAIRAHQQGVATDEWQLNSYRLSGAASLLRPRLLELTRDALQLRRQLGPNSPLPRVNKLIGGAAATLIGAVWMALRRK